MEHLDLADAFGQPGLDRPRLCENADKRAEQMLIVSDLEMLTSADLCVPFPPFPPSRCPSQLAPTVQQRPKCAPAHAHMVALYRCGAQPVCGRHAGEAAELAREMRLVGKARVGRDAGELPRTWAPAAPGSGWAPTDQPWVPACLAQ
ncbi:hypothetical protein [Acidovorax sp.]|uniref:hypothetical protein n=1 Tax=Acidovorax sp. TaxID=1872122 RepID=UPI002ACD9908|nr:hypothetical protein [Acidovorax sp.]MDZ7862995.1 hypothetical protein [Acidovorax sp.]